MPPYFYRYLENQLFDFYQRFAQESERTLIYLHDLPLSANPMSPELICRLLNTGRFAGILRARHCDGAVWSVLLVSARRR